MDNQPSFDRTIFIPIFLSGFSVIGIVVVLLIGRSLNSPAEVPVTPSATRFAYVYLGTEPAITTPLIEEEPPTEAPIEEEPEVEAPTEPPLVAMTPTRPGPLTPIVLPSATGNFQQTNTPVPPTLTSAAPAALSPGTYDDVFPGLVYSGSGWAANNSGRTLHVSTQPGSSVSFRFIGTQLHIRYDGDNTLGEMRVTVDNVNETFDQSDETDEWAWPDTLANVTHTVVITHVSGGAVNLDEIIIPVPPTPTPTPTRTSNP
jgi:hypothetical protein